MTDSGLSFDYGEEQDAIRASADRFCAQHAVREQARSTSAPFPRALWQQLAELGAFTLLLPGDAGGALSMCAILETLGGHLFPGPLAATYTALQVLSADTAAGVIDGRLLVSLSASGETLLPFAPDADLFLTVDGEQITMAHPPEYIEPVATLGGETWGRAPLTTAAPGQHAARALLVGNLASAAYLCGAGWHLLHDACSHAATRRQFGKTLGEFQAVSHPLADCAIALSAAQSLTRAAASAFDLSTAQCDDAWQQARHQGAGAVLSARRASLATAHVCHQVFGGIGITLEGPAFHVSRRIRQLASVPLAGQRERDVLLAAAGA